MCMCVCVWCVCESVHKVMIDLLVPYSTNGSSVWVLYHLVTFHNTSLQKLKLHK